MYSQQTRTRKLEAFFADVWYYYSSHYYYYRRTENRRGSTERHRCFTVTRIHCHIHDESGICTGNDRTQCETKVLLLKMILYVRDLDS